jgi:hypothetical protein
MAKKKGKGKTSSTSTAHQPRRSTVTPPKTVAEDSGDHAAAIQQPFPPLRLGTFDNEDDLYIDEEEEIVYMREEEEEEEEDELASSDSDSDSDNSLPPLPLKIIIPLKRNKPDMTKSGSKSIRLHLCKYLY